MKLKQIFAYLLISCTLLAHAGTDEPIAIKNSSSVQHAGNSLQNPSLSSTGGSYSSLVYPGEDGRLVYKPYTDMGDKILDFSYCGYKRSEEPIPTLPVVATLKPLPGAPTPDGSMAYPKGPDSRKQIQDALDKVASMQPDQQGFRGALLLKKGTYYVEGSLLVSSGVVLRGEGDGPEGTTIIFRNPRGTGIQLGNPKVNQKNIGEPVRITDSYIPASSTEVTVADAGQFKKGDYIIVTKTTNDKWISDLGMDHLTEISPDRTDNRVRNWKAESYQFSHLRKITHIQGNSITIDAQLPQSIAAEYGGGTVEKIIPGEIDSLCGVESLRVVSNYDKSVKEINRRTNKEYFSDEENNLNSGIGMTCINGWVRNCTGMHIRFAAVKVNNHSRFCTVRECKSLQPVSQIMGGRRYSFFIGGGSHSLYYNCYSEEGRHDFSVSSRIMGPNAFVKCNAYRSNSVSEPHHRWSTGILYDNITEKDGGSLGALNRGDSGSGHGWAAANTIFWNCDAIEIVVMDPPTPENNFAIGYTGEKRDEYPTNLLDYTNTRSDYKGTPKAGVYRGFALMGTGYIESPDQPVEPGSLFTKQLIDRIGKDRVLKVLGPKE